ALLQLNTPELTQVVVSETAAVAVQPVGQDTVPVDQAPTVQAKASSTQDSGLPVPDTPATPRTHSRTLVTRTNSNVRAEPSTNAEKGSRDTKGQNRQGVGKEGEWRQVGYEGGTGWVREDNFVIP